MDGRPDPRVPGLFRRLDERQSGAPAADQIHGPADFKLIERAPAAAPKPQQFRALEQKANIFLTAYVGFPVEPISMISNFDSGSAWTP
jgi:hypothetical protein